MRLKEIKTIDIFNRHWWDADNGNPYYARKIVVNLGMKSEKVFLITMAWGGVDYPENDYIEKLLGLPKSISFTRCNMFRYINYKVCKVRCIRYTFHPSKRVYNEETLDHPERFRNI